MNGVYSLTRSGSINSRRHYDLAAFLVLILPFFIVLALRITRGVRILFQILQYDCMWLLVSRLLAGLLPLMPIYSGSNYSIAWQNKTA